MRKRKKIHKLGGALLALGLVLSIAMPVQAAVTQEDLANPVVNEETHNQEGQGESNHDSHGTQYHYVYFGNYPQREIMGKELTEDIINATYDQYGDGEVNGRKIRRLSKELMTTYGCVNDGSIAFEKYRSTNGYRYYYYEPIKWRVYKNDGGTLFLVSDRGIEQQLYDAQSEIYWENCDLRKWLNYNGGEPEVVLGKGYSYRYPGFMYYAFSEEEKNRIQITKVQQDCNPVYKDSEGNPVSSGADTEDKIFILSYSDVANMEYGTCDDCGHGCQAAYFANTDYSGSLNMDNCRSIEERNYDADSWLRTVGKIEKNIFPGPMFLYALEYYPGDYTGTMNYYGSVPYQDTFYVVPALNLSYTLEDCIKVSFETNTDTKIEDQILIGSNYVKEPVMVADNGAETLIKLQRAGYSFTGWYTDKECTKLYNFNEKLTQDTTLYAGWIAIQEPPKDLTGGIMKIQGTTPAMEYATSTEEGVVWTSCQDGVTPVPKEGTWYVRYKETKEALASEAVPVNVISVDQATAEYIANNNIPESVVAVTDAVLLGKNTDSDIAGSAYSLLRAQASSTGKKSIKLKWNSVSGADGYDIYGTKCNTKKKKYKFKLIKTVKQGTRNTYSFTQKKLAKGTYYKYIVKAYKEIEGKKITIGVSKTIHATTTGGKYGNAKTVKLTTDKKLKKKSGSYTLTIKKNKKYTIKATEVKKSKKIHKHRAIAYESTDKSIATVSKKGVVKGKKKGTCYIYAYAQNGTSARIKVTIGNGETH